MIFRKLGRTGLDVGVIGIGTEFIVKESQDTVTAVVQKAVESGVNYFDMLWPETEYRDKMGTALKGYRDKVILTCQFGCVEEDGQPAKSRLNDVCEKSLYDFFKRIHTDYTDVLMIHNVDEEEDYERVMQPGGVYEFAMKLKKQGKARFIGMGSHKVPMPLKAVKSGLIDVLMFPVNPAFDALPAADNLDVLFGKTEKFTEDCNYKLEIVSERKELYLACESHGIGLVAMKPFASGRLLRASSQGAKAMTPTQCISYSLSQPAVSTIVAGVRSITELDADLEYLAASENERDFSQALKGSKLNMKGNCMYCNHCLPCPSGIDIGKTIRLIDSAINNNSTKLRDDYNGLNVKASECIKCGVCVERCPFGVDAVSKMEKAEELFKK